MVVLGSLTFGMKPGSQIASELPENLSDAREQQILDLVRQGNYVLNWVPLTVERNGLKATFFVSGDALRLGTPEDSFRVATKAKTEQQIADELNAVMPTPLLSDEIYRQAHIKLIPKPQGTSKMGSMTQMIKHHNAVEKQLTAVLPKLGFDPSDALIAPVGKDWVNSRRLLGNPTVNGAPAAINYGWQRTDLPPVPKIGPFPAATGYPPLVVHQSPGMAHDFNHQDYSQVVRLVSRLVKVCTPTGVSGLGASAPGDCIEGESCTLPDGNPGKVTCMDIYNVATDPVLNVLVNHDGPVPMRHFAVPYQLPVGQHHGIWGGVTPSPPPPFNIDSPPAGDHPAGPPMLDKLAAQAGVGTRVAMFGAGAALGWWLWQLGTKR